MSGILEKSARQVTSVHQAFRTLEGDGFEVRRAIPSENFEAVGPFIFFDHFGPIRIKPGEAKGASAHPHAGIETLTLLLEGSSEHKDSLGNVSSMGPGEVQWLRPGRGVIHDERPDQTVRDSGGDLHGVQLWINMPKAHKHDDPTYRHIKSSEIPVRTVDDGSVRARVVAGRLGELVGPIKTWGEPFVAHISIKAGGRDDFLIQDAAELAAYVMMGAARIGAGLEVVEAGQLAKLSAGDAVTVSANIDTELLLIGGDPLDAPIMRNGPFVMNSTADLDRAVRDYQAGRMGTLSKVLA